MPELDSDSDLEWELAEVSMTVEGWVLHWGRTVLVKRSPWVSDLGGWTEKGQVLQSGTVIVSGLASETPWEADLQSRYPHPRQDRTQE
jgi:hypothetical protein